jgi:hypothetical protein
MTVVQHLSALAMKLRTLPYNNRLFCALDLRDVMQYFCYSMFFRKIKKTFQLYKLLKKKHAVYEFFCDSAKILLAGESWTPGEKLCENAAMSLEQQTISTPIFR